MIDLPYSLDESSHFDFLVRRGDPDDPLNLLDVLSIERISVQHDLPLAPTQRVEYNLRRGDSEGARFPSLCFPLERDELENLRETGVLDDGAEGGEGTGDVELVRAAEEAEDGGEIRREEGLESGGEAGDGADDLEGRATESRPFGGELLGAQSVNKQKNVDRQQVDARSARSRRRIPSCGDRR